MCVCQVMCEVETSTIKLHIDKLFCSVTKFERIYFIAITIILLSNCTRKYQSQ